MRAGTHDRLIAEITDETIGIGQMRTSKAPSRLTARAIVRDGRGRFAVVHMDQYAVASMPGGGIEPGETPAQAAVREVAEETGWNCHILAYLGRVVENRGRLDDAKYTYWYVMERVSPAADALLTPAEVAEGTHCEWVPMDEMLHRIRDAKHTQECFRFWQARDLAALDAYQTWMKEQKNGTNRLELDADERG